jgi:hypothetical protein
MSLHIKPAWILIFLQSILTIFVRSIESVICLCRAYLSGLEDVISGNNPSRNVHHASILKSILDCRYQSISGCIKLLWHWIFGKYL